MADKKYYWLKLKRDFFKRHDIRIIENMPNGKDYVLFYLKLLCESVDHEGDLRFSENIPYNEDMLATITNTNIDVVRSAVKIFTELNMMEIMTDGTYYMNEVYKMIGTSTQDDHTRESTRLRVRACRERKKQELIGQERYSNVTSCYSNVTCNGEKEIDIDKEIDKEIDIDIDTEIDISTNVDIISPDGDNICPDGHISTQAEKKPVKHQYGEYKKVLLSDDEYNKLVTEYGLEKTEQAIKFLDEYIAEKGYKSKVHYLAMKRWVFNAIEEKAQKGKNTNKTAQQLDSFYAMAKEWSESE